MSSKQDSNEHTSLVSDTSDDKKPILVPPSRNCPPNGRENASWYSFLFWQWPYDILLTSRKRDLIEDDVDDITPFGIYLL